MAKITVTLDPDARQRHIEYLLALDGLSGIKEDPLKAYCPVSLTGTPDDHKPLVQVRQNILVDILNAAGIKEYDPANTKAIYSPDNNPAALPNAVYAGDSEQIVSARYFVGHLLFASTGQGVECEKAKNYNRVSVMLAQKGIKVTRMLPHRAIYLEYENFEAQKNEFAPVFEFLKGFEPGAGFKGELPILLGFPKRGSEVVDLESAVYETFPNLRANYVKDAPMLKLGLYNPEALYENKRT